LLRSTTNLTLQVQPFSWHIQ